MKFVADLHLHSKYSRAVSQDMVLPKMAHWAAIKGINVLATGDFTHPFWFDQLKNELEEVEEGLYRLKTNDKGLMSSQTRLTQKDRALDVGRSALDQKVFFLLSCEIEALFKDNQKFRKVHTIFMFPKLSSVEKFNQELSKRRFNLRSDGRPKLGMKLRDLVEIALNCDEKVLIIPAHIWTPWFGAFGSMSGFDSLEEAFEDLTDKIYGIETGLSSDPAMNWLIANLDNRSILSFSDAHSLEKMGREATVFEASEVSYGAIYEAIVGPARRHPRPTSSLHSNLEIMHGNSSDAAGARRGSPTPVTHNLNQTSNLAIKQLSDSKIAFTIEFYPEEGKYHFTGHRDCNFSQSPEETKARGDMCPVCKRKLTVGVMHRVDELKARNMKQETRDISGIKWNYPQGNSRPPYVNLVPLSEIIAEAEGTAVKTKKVFDAYSSLINSLGSEFNVLMIASGDELRRYTSPKIVEGIERVRSGNINIDPGYDGKFGEVKIWKEASAEEKPESQLNLFA